MGEELLHNPTPIGQGPRRGAYIVGYFEIVAGVEADGLRRRSRTWPALSGGGETAKKIAAPSIRPKRRISSYVQSHRRE
jgi:hypothetical protein